MTELHAIHCRPPGERATEVRIGRGLRGRLGEWLQGRRTFVLADARVVHAELPTPDLTVEGGEAVKTLGSLESVLRAMATAGVDRGSLLVCIGGGTVGDLGGLAAALHHRGIEHWQVPTTLLSMADSAIGGKTAVNLPEGKNLVGAVHPASLVVVDPTFCATLDEREYRSGLAETLKIAIGRDAELFSLLERQRDALLRRDPQLLVEVLHRAVAAKVAVVEADPREHGVRRLLNLGHTLGHALESRAQGTVPHGLCVAQGIHFALALALAERAISATDAARCTRLLESYGFVREPLPPCHELAPWLARDKKRVDTTLHFAMPTGVGTSAVVPMPLRRIESALPGGC
ncbi:MAG: hypothetical protein RL148_568 [Planctomycetota bacterium]